MTDVRRLRLGALPWNQYTTWDDLLAAGQWADRLQFDTLWTWDHLYPIVGSTNGPILEGWLTLAAWAASTKNVRLGLMVGANTFRNPALVAKMATTLDHISHGRAILGIGSAWVEEEHMAFGLRFGSGPSERLRWLAEALPIMQGMLRGERPTASGPRYRVHEVQNLPPPMQDRLPLLIGGGGEQVTLKLVARYADANNLSGTAANIARKEAILVQHCEAEGRDPTEIERTAGIGVVVIRDSREHARRVYADACEWNGKGQPWEDQPVGTPEDVAAYIAERRAIGYHHLIATFPSPHDEESMIRLSGEVRALAERDQG